MVGDHGTGEKNNTKIAFKNEQVAEQSSLENLGYTVTASIIKPFVEDFLHFLVAEFS